MGRHYPTPAGNLPSVTTIIDATESTKSKASLQSWNKKNPGKGQAARDRGSFIHECQHQLLTTGQLPEDLRGWDEWITPLVTPLQYFQREGLVWSERAIDTEKYAQYTWTDPEDNTLKGMLWCEQYAGCPDMVGKFNQGGVCLADLKTSEKPYYPQEPEAYGLGKRLLASFAGDRDAYNQYTENRKAYVNGWRKYWKTCMQLAAYDHLVRERLGVVPDQHMILVATPGHTQVFKLTDGTRLRAKRAWDAKLKQYYDNLASTESKIPALAISN